MTFTIGITECRFTAIVAFFETIGIFFQAARSAVGADKVITAGGNLTVFQAGSVIAVVGAIIAFFAGIDYAVATGTGWSWFAGRRRVRISGV